MVTDGPLDEWEEATPKWAKPDKWEDKQDQSNQCLVQ